MVIAFALLEGVTTSFLYDVMGQLAAEYGGPMNAESGIRFLFVDGLSSMRVSVKEDGTDLRRFDYWPFSRELVTANWTGALGYGMRLRGSREMGRMLAI